MIRKSILILTILGILTSLLWLKDNPGWEPFTAVIITIAALIPQLSKSGDNDKKVKMTQKGGENSTNYQSAQDININTKNDK